MKHGLVHSSSGTVASFINVEHKVMCTINGGVDVEEAEKGREKREKAFPPSGPSSGTRKGSVSTRHGQDGGKDVDGL